MNKLTAMKEPSLPTRIQAEDTSLSDGCGMVHFTRVTSWATGLSQSILPLAPDTAATKAQGVEKPEGVEVAGTWLVSDCVLPLPVFLILCLSHMTEPTFLYYPLGPGHWCWCQVE